MAASEQIVGRLIALAKRLRRESAEFLEQPGDSQSWYNRGYGGGILSAMRELGYSNALDDECAQDDAQSLAPHRIMAWGQAYAHGFEKGVEDTRDVLPRDKPD